MPIWLTEIWHSWRSSLRRPGFLLLATGVLALGIGASVAVFVLINGTLLQRLPFPQASRVVVLGKIFSGEVGPISPHEYQFLKNIPGVKALGLIRPGSVANISGAGVPQQVPVTYMDRGMLPALGIQPILGRNFNAAEDRPGGPPVVMLSHGLWQRRYGGARDMVGHRMLVEGRAATIIGVLPKGLDTLSHGGGIFLPLALPAASRDYDHSGHMAIARLEAGVPIRSIAAQVDARERAMYRDMGMGGRWDRPQFGTATLDVTLHRGERPLLMLFTASAAMVLLIALVNLTNLMLLRTLSRTHDIAVRHALGAPFLRLLLPAVGEGLLVGMGGAFIGMALAWGGLAVLRQRIPVEWLHGGQITVGAMAWLFAFAVAVIGALLAAWLGVWRSRQAMGVDTLREGGRSGLGLRSGRLGRALVVAQVAMAVALLSSAGVIAHSLYVASRTHLGFSSDHILTFELAPVKAHYPDAASIQAMSQRLVQRLRLMPGVTGAAVTTNLPTGDGLYDQFNNRVETAGGKQFYAQLHGVGNGFFRVFSIARYQGRVFTHDDTRGSEPVAVVSRDLARKYYDGDAVGKLIKIDMNEGPAIPVRIVGVVASTYQYGPLAPMQPVLYVPLVQMPASTFEVVQKIEPLRFALHVQGRVAGWRAAVQKAVAEVVPGQPISHLRAMRAIVRQTTANGRLSMWLVSLFASLALLLAVAGLYAVMAVAVASREREFGTRMALGASPARLIQLVVRGGMYQVAIGLVLGMVLAWGAARVLAHMSEALSVTGVGHIDQVDPLAWVLVCVVLALAGFAACLRPAWRASRVPPMRALRGE
ncbi:ABC transporter permease [Oleiagrimonas sp. MCCC 1A03011]|uniref:ABC transporter permease n=1 Tax=Oleiagrimonas sp. MCCC 1A03011 TaxID=1926883 RepID=UPI000DC2E308|nr:ABC transporter permease [Oleiagrimonas sp. MCCC 1A03011]RAP59568.1 permease [Oleiagrimonas sp. MCCC 1A03011]